MRVKDHERREARRIKEQAAKQAAPVKPTAELAHAVDWLTRQEDCDPLLTDPP